MTTNQLDIDKYEGHTEGEWILNRSEANPTEFLLKCGDVTITWLEPSEADAQLIADAPLLLEEVKRLRDIVCLLEDSRIRGLSIFDRPQLFDDVLQIHTQRNEQGNGDLPPFECVGEEE